MGIRQRTHLCMAKSRAAIVHVCSAGMIAVALSFPVDATFFTITNLLTDNQGVNAAQIADPKLINAWGISHSPGSPFWVSALDVSASDNNLVSARFRAGTIDVLKGTAGAPNLASRTRTCPGAMHPSTSQVWWGTQCDMRVAGCGQAR